MKSCRRFYDYEVLLEKRICLHFRRDKVLIGSDIAVMLCHAFGIYTVANSSFTLSVVKYRICINYLLFSVGNYI